MHRLGLSFHLVVCSFAVLTVLAACDPGSTLPADCDGNDDCETDQICRDGRCVDRGPEMDGGSPGDGGGTPGRDAGPTPTLVSIAIEPATATLISSDGSMPEQIFGVVGTYSDGFSRALTGARFSIAPISLGTIDEANGRFVSNGFIGGVGTVTATVNGPAGELSATATVTVQLTRTLVGAGVPGDVVSRFAAPPVTDDARRASLVYPLDGAVMPQNVYPADIQWLRGVTGDLFRVTLAKPNATVVSYLVHDGSLRNHWLVDEAAWRGIAQTDPDADATITVDRLDVATSEVIAGTPIRVRFARAALTGSVYYWDIQAGRIIRIDDGTATANSIMPTPPLSIQPVPAPPTPERCVGCHTVSNSGRYMAGRLGGGENIGAVFDLTQDLTGDPPPTVFPLNNTSHADSSIRWWFSSWSPDDSRLAVSIDQGGTLALRIYDPFAGTEVAITGTLPPSQTTHPAWSPDGTQIAYVSDPGVWGGANTAGNISVIDVPAPDTVGAITVLHTGASLAGEVPGGVADSYPTWSPDSARIAFAHGTGSRSETEQSALYIMNRDGTGVVRLSNACTATGVDNFQPRFSPFEQGGYQWLSFLSRRPYGNAEVGTGPSGFQQIWVTAIRTGAAAGEDPSSVPYWLPGQAVTSRNISAYWAPRPCRPDGEACSVGSECCGGDCRPGADGVPVCSPPPPERCRMANETCSTDEDCCDGLSCFNNVCTFPIE